MSLVVLLVGALLGVVGFELRALAGRAAGALAGAEPDGVALALAPAFCGAGGLGAELALAALDGTDGASANAGVASRPRRMLLSQ